MDAEQKKQIDEYLALPEEVRREHIIDLIARLERHNTRNPDKETQRCIKNLKAVLWARYKTLVS